MKEMTLQREKLNLQERIKDLPTGYISSKIIAGKKRYYLRQKYSGKSYDKYLSADLAEKIRPQIIERRQCQKKLNEINKLLATSHPSNRVRMSIFKTNVITGNALKSYFRPVVNMKKRSCFSSLKDYLYGDSFDRVMVLYGLRRTGKTTLIRQVLAAMAKEDLSKSAVIEITPSDSLDDVIADLWILFNRNFHYVFIDEITLAKDFILKAAILADIFAGMGMKIVLSGTDSLGFEFARRDSLFDRTFFIHTTFIPYKEFEEVLGIVGIDEYIRYGGLMSFGGTHYNQLSTFADNNKTDEYVDNAIAQNIQHSLKYYDNGTRFRCLKDLYDHNELTGAINRVIEDFNHQFTLQALTDDFLSHDLGISAKNLKLDKDNPTDILYRVKKEEFTNRLKQVLKIKNQDEAEVKITDAHRAEIKNYLDLLDLSKDIEVNVLPSGDRFYRTLFAQPGMRYCQAKALLATLYKDDAFQTLSPREQTLVANRISNEIKGRMMEDIVLLETMFSFPFKEIYKLQFSMGEFDMVIRDKENSSIEIYEIKHSKKLDPAQVKNLLDKEKIKDVEYYYGEIRGKYVIYRGESTTYRGIKYINVEEYLKGLQFVPLLYW